MMMIGELEYLSGSCKALNLISHTFQCKRYISIAPNL